MERGQEPPARARRRAVGRPAAAPVHRPGPGRRAPGPVSMDEPCSALDPTSTARIEQTIADIADDVTVVIVTHNMQQAQRVSHPCAFFLAAENEPGRIVESGRHRHDLHQPERHENPGLRPWPIRLSIRWRRPWPDAGTCGRGGWPTACFGRRDCRCWSRCSDRRAAGFGVPTAAVHGVELRRGGHSSSGSDRPARCTDSTSISRCHRRSSGSTTSPRTRRISPPPTFPTARARPTAHPTPALSVPARRGRCLGLHVQPHRDQRAADHGPDPQCPDIEGIFTGRDHHWNDQRSSRQLNPQLVGDLPGTTIIAGVPGGCVGENYLLSDYLLHLDGQRLSGLPERR